MTSSLSRAALGEEMPECAAMVIRDTEYLEIEQIDGLLQVEVNDPISYYEGGVYRDDTMAMGGYATDYGGSVEMTALVEGRFEGDRLIADARSRIWGEVELGGEVVALDCEGTYTLEGVWRETSWDR